MKSLNIDANTGVASTPLSLLIDRVELTNYQGKVQDIFPVVATVSIIESLYSPSLLFELGIKDQSNLIEDLPIIGQEKITIIARRKGLNELEEREIQLTFFVTEIPSYSRGENNNEQLYVIKGISEFAFKNSFMTICRSYREPSSTEIQKIFVNDLKLEEDKFNVLGNDLSKSKGVINIQRPLAAAEFFKQAAYDDKGSPFFLFQTLNGNVNFISLSKLVSAQENPQYGKDFFVSKIGNKRPGTQEEYTETSKNIIKLGSKLNLTKYKQAAAGAFASENNFLDWSDKTYQPKIYDFDADIDREASTLDQQKVFSEQFTINNLSLNKIPTSHSEYLSVNKQAFTEFDNYGASQGKSRFKTNAYHALLETFTHDIRLPGDLQLNAGRKIRINFPKAKDPATLSQADLTDELISGLFIITSCSHSIEGGKYFCDLRIKRDSFGIDLEAEEVI